MGCKNSVYERTSNFSGCPKNQFKYKMQHSRTDSLGRTYSIDIKHCNRSVNRFFKPHIGILAYLVPDKKSILAYAFLI